MIINIFKRNKHTLNGTCFHVGCYPKIPLKISEIDENVSLRPQKGFCNRQFVATLLDGLYEIEYEIQGYFKFMPAFYEHQHEY